MKLNDNCLRFIPIVILSGILFFCTACSSSTGSKGCAVKDFGNDDSIHQESITQDNDSRETNQHNSPDDIHEPWENGGKPPDQYTWEELQALTDIQKEYFFEWFVSAEEYKNWLSNAKTNDIVENMPWENGGKTPNQYSWEELQALTDIQKEYFFEWFDSTEAYENWLDNAKPNDAPDDMPWENGGKTPDEYTWEELQALTDIQKEYFFEWFASASDFEAWMNSVK